ncbi:MAG: hypothetical protein RL291_2128 [Pseudomonadota bacterium]
MAADDATPAPKGDGEKPEEHSVDPKVLELLVCPQTRTTLSYKKDAQALVSPRPKLAYSIVNGVPIMVASEARELDDHDPLLKR